MFLWNDRAVIPGGAAAGAGGHRRRWVLLACMLLTAGIAVSLTSALLWRASVRSHESQAFQGTSTDVSETLVTLLRRDNDFVTTLRGVLTMEPHLSPTRFKQWYAALQGTQRQVGTVGTSVVEPVLADQLGAFEARRDSDPAFRALEGGVVLPIPRTGRTRYCLLSAGGAVVPTSEAIATYLQGDWCDPSTPVGSFAAAGTIGARLLPSLAGSGRVVAYPYIAPGVNTLFIEAAFYKPGVPIATAAQRRRALAGWLNSSFDVNALIGQAVGSHGKLNLTLYHSNPGEPQGVIGEAGAPVKSAPFTHRTTLDMDGRWVVVVQGSAVSSGLSANAQGLLVMAVGSVVSVLLSAFVLVLARSRERALGMVERKTGELRHQALHDALTGLPNRLLALDRAQQMIARAARHGVPVAALYVDLDGFKQINDTYGHAAGDELLRTVAERLLTVIRSADTAARLGGDEFVVLLEGATLDAGPELVAERLLEVLGEPYDFNGTLGRPLKVTASIGIAVGGRATADELLRDADLALYEAKEAGRSRYAMFESSMQNAARDKLIIEMDLADALAHEELFLLYQPTFDLRSESVIGVEALIRWQHPTRGVVLPDEFIPIAESSRLIVPIGRWVLQQACGQAARWREQGYAIGISVNVSARQLEDDVLIEDVQRALADSGLDAGALTLEVTETALMRDPEATAERLAILKRIGIRIAIDDFGTGYSSLAYLRQFPADALKIDRSFIDGIANPGASAALIRTLVQLGKTLNIETLAEGIEDQAQLEALQREHCDQGQGFLFSRPLDARSIEAFLDTKTNLLVASNLDSATPSTSGETARS
jgi:diguanylate cyclase (GGDEF)-like protein